MTYSNKTTHPYLSRYFKIIGILATFLGLLATSLPTDATNLIPCRNRLIYTEQPINFGDFYTLGVAGWVTVDTGGGPSYSNVVPLGGIVNAGLITVSVRNLPPSGNCDCYPIIIDTTTGPPSGILGSASGGTMPVNTIVTNPTTADAVTLINGTRQIYVGATLTVGATQPAGAYDTALDTPYLFTVDLGSKPGPNPTQCP